MSHPHRLAVPPPLFEPLEGAVVRPPGGEGPGWWAGAPGVFHDSARSRFYLTYRLREPRPVRGGITRLAVSDDGIHFDDCAKSGSECS